VVTYVGLEVEINALLTLELDGGVHHKTGGSGFDSRYGHWRFSSDLFLLSIFTGPGVHSASDRNENQGISLGLK
jgi:hypothetical protein